MLTNRQELYVVPVLAHLQVLARLATTPLEVRCKPLHYVLIGVMLKLMHSPQTSDANQQFIVSPVSADLQPALCCCLARQWLELFNDKTSLRSMLFCGNDMPMLCHCMPPG